MKFKFFIRNDIDFIRNDISKSDKDIIIKKLLSIFERYYNGVDICVIDVNEQINKANNDLVNDDIISLDCWYNKGKKFRFSRVFEYGGLQDRPIGYIHSDLPLIDNDKVYTLVDDDVCSGYTIKTVASLLGLSKYNVYPMLKYDGVYDVVDVRDFIIGSEYGGLMTDKGRFMYVHPHVNLETRASLMGDKINFSKEVLLLNKEINEIETNRFIKAK